MQEKNCAPFYLYPTNIINLISDGEVDHDSSFFASILLLLFEKCIKDKIFQRPISNFMKRSKKTSPSQRSSFFRDFSVKAAIDFLEGSKKTLPSQRSSRMGCFAGKPLEQIWFEFLAYTQKKHPVRLLHCKLD